MSDLNNWQKCPSPDSILLDGKYTRLEKLSVEKHFTTGLRDAMLCQDAGTRYLYMVQHAPASPEEAIADLQTKEVSVDPSFYAIVIKETGLAAGYISIMRIAPEHGVFEIGNVYMGPSIARTRVSTEAVYLLLSYGFDQLGYRRVEWKCNSLNEKSKSAATRFGFQYEGTFRKHFVVKGLNRDTAWFAMTDDDWKEGVKDSFERWLDIKNFSPEGNQINNLQSLR